MTLSRLSAVDSSNTNRSSFSAVSGTDNHKRKLDDYADYAVDFLQAMKKHELDADHMSASHQSWIPRGSGDNSGFNRSYYPEAECSSAREHLNRRESTQLQIFVRMMSVGQAIVIHADKNDTVEDLHRRIEQKTKIPVSEQRFIYKGKQLQTEQSLSYYSIEQDASLHLVGRMQSTEHPVAWQTVDDIMYTVTRLYRGELVYGGISSINAKLAAFFAMIPSENEESIAKYLKIFSNSSVPEALVSLYASSLEINKACAKGAIKLFLSSCVTLTKNQQSCCVPVMLEFCRLLRNVCPDNKLYVSCRNALGSLLDSVDSHGKIHGQVSTFAKEIFPFFSDLGDLLVKELSLNSGPNSCDVQKFSSFWLSIKNSVHFQVYDFPVAIPVPNGMLEKELKHLHLLFEKFLNTMDACMKKVESCLDLNRARSSETTSGSWSSWSQYLSILKIMHSISKICQGGKATLAGLLRSRKTSFCALVVKFTKRGDDHQWIYEYVEATNFEARRHLAMLLFPDVKEDFEEMHEMLIDRSNLLAESFQYIAGATPESLHGGLFMEFKNEEATGPGVLREWFYLVCQEIFNPRNTLFLRSDDDYRRFSPNPASKVDPLHPDFFEFTGRMIALALMHKVQVGVLFDRVFFLQLAGKEVTLEDIKDTDRIMYNSCKQILEMDPVFFDSNSGLDLTFVLETEELGKRDVIELCQGGKSIAVNSRNRKLYVDLLINQRFAKTISEQVKQFSKGFMDILSESVPPNLFFQRLYLQDLDGMLRGGECPISIDDWKAHTEYSGFKETDRQIDWFWKILKRMSDEERRSILFFWTSNKFIPVEGFRGLSSKLFLYRLYEADDRLPLSHTCFYRLCIPKYPTMGLMENRLRLIAQDHVSNSFGRW